MLPNVQIQAIDTIDYSAVHYLIFLVHIIQPLNTQILVI